MSLSLSQRLIIATTVMLTVLLLCAGLLLDKAFEISLDNIVREKLKTETYNLLALADRKSDGIQLPKRLPDDRYNSENGAALALIISADGREAWSSISAANLAIDLPLPDEGQWMFGQAENKEGHAYYVSSFKTFWSDSTGGKDVFYFTVLENLDLYQAEIEEFRFKVGLSLLVLTAIVVSVQFLVLQWGLLPLRRLAADVVEMNEGHRDTLEGEYSKELSPLTSNLNILIENERRQRLRFRERMDDLSHSLKTPLSVLRSLEVDVTSDGQPIPREQIIQTLKRQVGRMNDTVNYQLQRAVASNQKLSFLAVPVFEEVVLIVRALDKVYAEKEVDTKIEIDERLYVYADENDVAEVMGNLVENAYKYCHKLVQISAIVVVNSRGNKRVEVSIEDDGAGIPASLRSNVLKRGVRLDTSQEGQGFGLAIAAEIVGNYTGDIAVLDSELGGAKFKFDFPTK